MEREKSGTQLVIDGYEITATFADNKNTEAIGQVKQILLSSFVARGARSRPKGILAIHPGQRDNIDGGSPDDVP